MRGVKHRVEKLCVCVCVCVCVCIRSYSELQCMEGGQSMFFNVCWVAQCKVS